VTWWPARVSAPSAGGWKMNFHRVVLSLVDFRGRRIALLRRAFRFSPNTRVIDVGGLPWTWSDERAPRVRVVHVNLKFDEQQRADARHLGYLVVLGDGTALPFTDGAADIAFSNSVIEHVSTWERQQRFAAELRRVARGLWIQTPARAFPIEPHWFGFGVHWLPKAVQRRVLRWTTAYGLLGRPSQAHVELSIREIRMLSKREMRSLFPDCEIWTERWLGLPKSYIAIKRPGE
jgi:hypothetical protein